MSKNIRFMFVCSLDYCNVLPVNGWVLQVQHLTSVVTQDEGEDRILH